MLWENILLQWRQNYYMRYDSYPRLLYHIYHNIQIACGVSCNQNTEDGKYLLPWCRYILSISLNTCRVIITETCWTGIVFPPGDLSFVLITISRLSQNQLYIWPKSTTWSHNIYIILHVCTLKKLRLDGHLEQGHHIRYYFLFYFLSLLF